MRRRIIVVLLLTTLILPVLSGHTSATVNDPPQRTTTTQQVSSPTQIPAPQDVLGFVPGDDRKLASWDQVIRYFEELDKASDRIKFEALGQSTMGKPFVMV